ncbi:Probable licABCH operon regulator [Listeria grayi]|nr:HTH domain-containing protein [Listeria grayi]STY44832.1 Probable licABCH operon regulator [Listeria grayi]
MRREMILNHLLNKEVHISLADLTESFQVSERTIRNEVKYLNEDGIKNGFRIQTLRGQGYQLQIENKPLFTDYLKKQTASFDTQSVSQRLLYLELLLFQQQDFITIDQLASQLQVSRSTIQQDLKRVDTFLHTYGLLLKRKAHYGVQIVGPEKKHRAALAKLLNTSSEQLSQTEAYRSFRKTLDIQALTLFIKERVTHYQIYISDVALRNMVDHVCILAFRVSQKNYIRMTGPLEKNPIYTALSKDIAAFIEAQYHLDVPEAEQDF